MLLLSLQIACSVGIGGHIIGLGQISSFFYSSPEYSVFLTRITYICRGNILGATVYQSSYFIQSTKTCAVRGSFKKFCYERLSVIRKRICITGFMYTYSSFYHTSTCEISKESSKYQHCHWHSK